MSQLQDHSLFFIIKSGALKLPIFKIRDQTDKPSSVVCGNLSRHIVAEMLKPSLPYIRRADVKIHDTNRRCIG